MIYLPVIGGSNMEDGMHGFHSGNGCKCLHVINAGHLGEALGYTLDFAAYYIASFVLFSMEMEFGSDDLSALWDGGSRYESPHFLCFE